jgi:uncharacterized protein (TIGR03118 family)
MTKRIGRCLFPASLVAIAVFAASAARADDGDGRSAYAVTDLVSDLASLGGKVVDPVLQNAWGMVFSPAASPFWISDNATGCSTLYDGDGTIVPLQVKIPLPGGIIPSTACKHADPANPPNPTPAAPTGIVWNPTSAFLVPGTTTASHFIWSTEDGTISAWASGAAATLAVDNSAVGPGAVYKGLVTGVNVRGVFLFATNFRAGTIDVVDNAFHAAVTDGGFTDPGIPPGYAPFGIQNIDGDLYVTYAEQNAQKHDDVAGAGKGFVDVFDTDGHMLRRLATRGVLNSPWAVVRASSAFGSFSGAILVGNFGDGTINAFSSGGRFLGTLRGTDHKALVIDGLWNLGLGGGAKSSSDTLYFTAGPNGETDGRFGTITPVPSSGGDD